ncbi:Flagellar hook-length control protein FliK [hydrothermal vent metagenome]|uniref:Flagellar hook-length control protein FliK n=1 Tax=hydrothermal vent metagenome TaxID=652676 RepID=A0A1W1C2N5_9ZZZZ
MRVTSSMYYHSLYATNNSKINNELFDVNKQIASGSKIQYGYENVTTFTDTMRLDNEITTLGQVKKSTESGYKVANQTDSVMSEVSDTLDKMKTLLIQAANGTNDSISLEAIADELKGTEKNLKSLANTSINGKYLFSGSKTDTKPISDDGKYQGNDGKLNAFVGANNQQQYNLSGADLFLGEERDIKKEITSNVINKDLINGGIIKADSTIRDLMGDIDDDKDTVNKNYFYIRGTKSDGSTFKDKVEFDDTASVSDLLEQIGKDYGNDGDTHLVDVELNSNGQIVVRDKQKGSSKLDFHMVGAVDFDDTGRASVEDIDDLDSGESDYNTVKNGDNHLFVHEFVKSQLDSTAGAANKIKGIVYDRTEFSKNGATLASNMPQIVRSDNSFANASTKISEVADISKGTAGTLDGTALKLVGKDINGNDYDVQIDLKSASNGGSSFTIGGNSYDIFNMDTPRTAVDADKMTYQQLMDVVNMVVTDNLPASNTADDYDRAIVASRSDAKTELSYDGKITFSDKTSANTKATVALYDKNSDNFIKDPSVITFNTNNALAIRDPKTDFFKMIDDAILAVQEQKTYPDANSGDMRNIGIENAIEKISDLENHVNRMHAKVGAQSNTLDTSLQRTQLLEISTVSLRSSVIDTDVAEASLKLKQLTLNYQAMLSSVGKVSKLSLVNYI